MAKKEQWKLYNRDGTPVGKKKLPMIKPKATIEVQADYMAGFDGYRKGKVVDLANTKWKKTKQY